MKTKKWFPALMAGFLAMCVLVASCAQSAGGDSGGGGSVSTLDFYINPGATTDGDGTEANPFNSLATLNDKIKSYPADNTLTVYVMRTIGIDSEITIAGTGKNITFCRYVNQTDDSKTLKIYLFDIITGGSLILKNITIDDKNIVINGSGGCVRIYAGSCTMIGGAITGGKASKGGAVHIEGNGTFTMKDGATLTGNEAEYGGAVCIGYLSAGTFNMEGGTITGNAATKKASSHASGGGVCIYMGTFNMTGGTISGNTVDIGYGGGVFVTAKQAFKISGNVQITNNKLDSSKSNVYLQYSSSNTVITVAGALDESSNIGVTLYDKGYDSAFTSGWSTSGSTKKEVFSGDESGYKVVQDGNELKLQKSN